MRCRARCSVCGDDALAFSNMPLEPCGSCGGIRYLFIPKKTVWWAGSFLFAAGVVGFIYWVDVFLSAFFIGRINFVVQSHVAMAEFIFALILLFCSSMAAIFSLQSFRGGRTNAILSGIFGFFAFGYGIGLVLAAAGLVLVAYYRKDFYV